MANAGGVIVSYFEWVQNLQHFRWEEDAVNHQLETMMRHAYREVSSKAQEDEISLRLAGLPDGHRAGAARRLAPAATSPSEGRLWREPPAPAVPALSQPSGVPCR